MVEGADPRASGIARRSTIPIGPPAWLFIAVLWVTWYPFRLRSGEAHVDLSPVFTPLDVVGNVLLFAPIGAVLALFGDGSAGRRVVRATTIAIGLSVLVEAGQWFVESRTVSPSDLFLNSVGAALAACVAVVLSSYFAKGRLGATVVGAVFVAVAAHVLLPALAVGPRNQLEEWDPDYLVLSGDEAGGERTYLGVVEDPEICAGRGAQTVCARPSADAETRHRLTEAAMGSQRVSVSARVTSASDRQAGPTRIVTFSAGPDERNVTLGQSGRDLVLRVRTPLTGPNGNDVQFVLGAVLKTGEPSRVGASFDRGRVTLTAMADGRIERGEFHPGLLQSWRLYRERLTAVEPFLNVDLRAFRAQAAISAAVLFMPLGLVATGRMRRRPWLAVVSAAALALAILYVLDSLLSRPPGRDHLIYSSVSAAVGATVALFNAARGGHLAGVHAS